MSNLLKENINLMKEWDYDKNNKINIFPNKLTYGSNKKVWWKCSKCGNEWEATINHRTIRKHGCPFCTGRYAIPGSNDLQTLNGDLLIDWDYEKNEQEPIYIKPGSHYSAWWKCHICNGEWQAPVYNRVKGNGCPYCSNKKILSGYNDLETKYPEIAIEWHPTKNKELTPNNVIPGSDKKVWWKCPTCNYEWETSITNRVNQGTGCPNCFKYWGTSFPEQALLFYLKQSYPNVDNRTIINNVEIDIYLPDENIGIEYDGYQWHKNSLKNDNKKDLICDENKIKLIRIRECGLSKTKTAINIFRESRSTSDLERIIKIVYNYLNAKLPQLDIHNDRNKIISDYISDRNKLSLLSINPELSKEWNYEKNKPLLPKMVSANCNEKVWWKCSKCGNEWESIIASRNKGVGCPQCAKTIRQKTRRDNIIKNGNSLSEKYPELLKEWNYSKNDLTPENVPYGYGKKVWWKCSKCGNEWEATVNTRTNIGAGCPYCAGKKVKANENDLKSLYPDLMKEWDYDKNNGLNIFPNELTYGSSKKAWWKCSKCGNEWETTINHRTIRKHGCPSCHHKILNKK